MKLDELQEAVKAVDRSEIQKFINVVSQHEKIIIIGNGGSNAIASHISQDYTKQLKKKAFSFSDPSRLTCYINDYGMEKAYAQFLDEFASQEDLVILISSSGNSPNVLNAAKHCIQHKIKFVILTGFDYNNKLNAYEKLTEASFWVDSKSYGVVECVHQIILHTPC
tara:strand:+ start:57 stop:554 length:498 start_codon:yes stop_codon:yes gene_type:complete